MAEQRDLSLATVFTANIESFRKGIAKIRSDMNALNADMARGAERSRRPLNDLAKAQALYSKRVKEMEPINNTYRRALDGIMRSTDGTARSQMNAIRYMDRMQQMVNKQARALQSAGKDGAKFAKEIDYVNLVAKDQAGLLQKTAQGFRVLDEASKKAGQSQSWVGKQIAQVEGAMSRLTAAMKVTAAYGVAATAIYGIVDALKSGVKEIIDFDQALKNLKAITGASDAEIRAMGETIKQVARTTKFSMTETADAMVLLGQAGFDAGESMDAIQATADLATGTLSDMTTVTDLLSTAIRAFNLESFQAGQVSDIMANAINKSKLTVDKLRIAFNYVGPAAYAIGAELEEVAASMMVLANSGLRASTIGTGLRQVFSRLVAPTAKLREAFQEHNIELEDLDVRMHGFSGVLRNLTEVFYNAETKAIDANKAFELFGLRGANSILALVRGIESGEFQQALDSVYEVGTAANMAATQIEGLALQFKNLQDRFKSLMVELGRRGFTDVLQGFLEVIRQTVILLTAFVEEGLGGVITTIGTFTTATAASTVALLALGKGLWAVTKRFIIFSRAMLSHPIGWLILAVGALASAYKRLDEAIKANLYKYEEEAIKARSRIEVLESYRKRLQEASKEAEKSQEGMKRYTDLVKRLKTEFKDLSGRIEETGTDFEQLNIILQDEVLVDWFNSVQAAADALSEQTKVVEWAKLTSGAMAALKAELRAGVSIWQQWLNVGADALTVAEFADFTGTIKGFKEVAKIGSEAGKKTAEWLKGAAEWTRQWGKDTEKTKKAQVVLTQAVTTLRDQLVLGYALGLNTVEQTEEVFKTLIELHKDDLKVVEQLTEAWKQALEIMQKREEQKEIEPLRYTTAEAPFEEMVKKAEGFRQVQLVSLKRQIDQEVAAYKDGAKKRGIAEEEVQKNIAVIRFQGLMKAYDIYDQETKLEWQRNEKRKAWALKYLDAYEKYTAEELAKTQEVIDKANEQYEKGSAEQTKIVERGNKKKAALDNAYVGTVKGVQDEITRLTKESTDDRLAYEYERQLKVREEGAKRAIAQIEKDGAEEKRRREEIAVDVADIEVQLAQDRLKLAEEYFDSTAKIYKKDSLEFVTASDEKEAAITRLAQALAAYAEAVANLGKKERKLSFKDITDQYKEGKLTAEQYYEYVKQAREDDLISETEYMDQRAILMEGYWASFKRGLLAARREVKSFSEMFYSIASELPAMFAERMTDALSDVIDGTKSFGEAVINVFSEILKYIGQTIVQMTILKAIMQGISLFGGFRSGVTSGDISKGPVEATLPDIPHGGGIMGIDPLPVRIVNPKIFENARRLHNGLKSNEFPAILEKDEGVFTKGQMKALGRKMEQPQGLTINVPINVEHVSPRFTAGLRVEVENTVKRYIRTELV